MSDLHSLPEWVWNLLDALSDYEDQHPQLFRQVFSSDDPVSAQCIGSMLTERYAWPPEEVMAASAFRRVLLRDHTRVHIEPCGDEKPHAQHEHRTPAYSGQWYACPGIVRPRTCRMCGDPVVWHEGNGGQWIGAVAPRDWMACHGRVDGPRHEVSEIGTPLDRRPGSADE